MKKSDADASLNEVRLEGTFNVLRDSFAEQGILYEAIRVLRPGGKLHVDVFVKGGTTSDSLPASIEHLPTEESILALLANCGFVEPVVAVKSETESLRQIEVVASRPFPTRAPESAHQPMCS